MAKSPEERAKERAEKVAELFPGAALAWPGRNLVAYRASLQGLVVLQDLDSGLILDVREAE